MTITVLPMDATAGAPAYSAKNARQAQAALYGNPTGRVFGTRSGWRVGTLSSIVSVTSTTWTLNPCACMIEPAAQLYQGAYGWASDQVITGPMTAADGTNPRIDILYIQVNDSSAGDGSGALSANVSYLAGTAAPSGTQVAPALPPRSFLVATIAVPKSGGGSPTVTFNSTYFVAAGAPVPVSSATELATLTTYPGLSVTRLDQGGQSQTWNGAGWTPLYSTMAPLSVAGYLISGTITMVPIAGKTRVDLDITVQLNNGSGLAVGTAWAAIGAIIPAAARSAAGAPKYTPVIYDFGSMNVISQTYLDTTTGIISIRNATSFTWNNAGRFFLTTSYYL